MGHIRAAFKASIHRNNRMDGAPLPPLVYFASSINTVLFTTRSPWRSRMTINKQGRLCKLGHVLEQHRR